jgi:signal transduction histidine kinase
MDRVTMNSKITALERAKSDFLNIASHELRGPMTAIYQRKRNRCCRCSSPSPTRSTGWSSR